MRIRLIKYFKELSFEQKIKFLFVSLVLVFSLSVMFGIARFNSIALQDSIKEETDELEHLAIAFGIVLKQSYTEESIQYFLYHFNNDTNKNIKSHKNRHHWSPLTFYSKKHSKYFLERIKSNKNQYKIESPVIFDGKNYGYLSINYDFEEKSKTIYVFALELAATFLITISIILFLFLKFLKMSITRPLQGFIALTKNEKVDITRFYAKDKADPLLVKLAISFDTMIDRLKNERRSLENATEFQKHLLDTVDAGILVCEVDGKIIQFNRGAKLMLNSERLNGLLAHNFLPFIKPPFKKRIRTTGGEAVLPDGEKIPVSIRLQPFSRDDKVFCVISIRSQKKLREQMGRVQALQKRFEALAKGTNDGIWDWKIKTNEIWYSDRWAEMFGYDISEITQKMSSWESIVCHEDKIRTIELTDKFIKGDVDSFEITQRYKHKNGSTVYVLCRAILVSGPDHDDHLIGTYTNITDFIEAQHKIEAANQAKKEFLANMSHEIRTPMNAVLGMADALDGTKLTKKQKDYLHTIISSGQHLLALINDILDFSKIEAGKLSITPSDNDFLKVLRESSDLFVSTAEKKGIKLIIDMPEKMPDLFYDENRLRQVIHNFLSNAIKFTDTGSVTLRVNSFAFEGNLMLNVFVSDSGIGVKQEDLPKLFNSFSQADNSSTRSHEGTGLGLAICKRIIELMGGTVGIQSVYGEGTTVWFAISLPVSKTKKIDSKPSDIKAPAYRLINKKVIAKNARILVVEDNKVNQKVLKLMLTSFGLNCEIVGDGNSAVEKALSDSFDLIFMDIQLPGIDGVTASKMIQKEKPESTIVFLTAHALDEQREMYQKEVKTLDYLTKPIDKKLLKNVLEKIFILQA